MHPNMRQAPAESALIFHTRYNPCPRYPTGTVWQVGMRSRYCSCAWNMERFAEALNYLRDQWAKEKAATASPRGPGDQHRANEFWGWIEGPGGRLDWRTLESIVKAA